jgi:hypothetical protein
LRDRTEERPGAFAEASIQNEHGTDQNAEDGERYKSKPDIPNDAVWLHRASNFTKQDARRVGGNLRVGSHDLR